MSDFERSRDGDAAGGQRSGGDDLASPGKRSLTQLTEGSSSTSLPGGMRGDLEKGMGGQDLSGVKVHVDDKAAQAASSLNAKAFTVGQSIYFGAGQYDPGSASGQKLIAHETAHTVQQKGATQTAQLASLDVSTPGDAHETEAEGFAESFVGGGKAGPITPVSKGVVQRAVIQRDLLDGAPPPGLDQPAHPIDVKQPSAAELAEKAHEAIKKARGEGGTQAVVHMVGTLRSNASANTRGAVESAIQSELNEDEKKALSGGGTTSSSSTAPTSTPPAKETAGTAAKDHKADKADGDKKAAGDDKKAGDAHGKDAKGDGHADAKGAAGGEGKDGKDAAGGDHEAGGADAGHGAAGGQQKKKGEDKGGEGAAHGGAKPAHGAAGAAHGPAGGEHGGDAAGGEHGAPVGGEQKPIPEAAGKELIEAELAFHDRWKVYQGGAGDRAAHLARTLFYADGPGGVGSNIMNGDLVRGMTGASVFVGAGLAMKLAATKTPLSRIPGIGNIIGGGLTAYNLFHNGGAGIKEMAGHVTHGIGGAMSAKNWKESPFLTAANLIEGITGVLEIVGGVCNILSGLAYAFAAIAAVGGLLSIFFPPLAFLVPYIPVAVNFGRACGGIATTCTAVSYLLSPLIAIFRALHQIFSDQDPVKLAAEEDEYHSAAQGAISTYGSTIMQAKLDQHGPKALGATGEAPKKVLGSTFLGENLKEAGEGISTVRSTMGGGVANTRQALGADRPATEVSKDYFNPNARTQVAQSEHHHEEKKLEKEEGKLETMKKDQAYVERRADQAVARRDADPTPDNMKRVDNATKTAERHELRVSTQEGVIENQHHNVERAEVRTQIPLGRQGELGHDGMGGIGGEFAEGAENLFDEETEKPAKAREKRENAAAAAAETNQGGGGHGGGGGGHGDGGHGEGGHGEGHVAAPLDAKGHIILPSPPGRLQEIDSIDQEIHKLEGEKKELHATGSDARVTQQDAAKRASGLKAASTDVKTYVTNKQTHSKTEQARIQTQTTDIQTKTGQATAKVSQGGNQASLPIRAVAGGARTVDGLLQRIPSNKFFDISSAKTNVHKFVVGMDEIMGVDGKNQATKGQADAAVADRTQKTQQAAQKNSAATAAGTQLATTMTQDASTAQTSATQAGAVADQAKEAEHGHESKIQQLRSDRQQKWSALLGWAAQHRSLRESATKAEH